MVVDKRFRFYAVNRDFISVQWPSNVSLTFEQQNALAVLSQIPGIRVEDLSVRVPVNTLVLPLVRSKLLLFAAVEDLSSVAAQTKDVVYPHELWQPDRPPFQYQADEALEVLRARKRLVSYDMGLGKLQPVSAAVLTPTGFVPIGTLRVGDLVVDPDGGVGTVTGVFPQGVKDTWCVRTKSGAETRAGADHLWLVQSATHKLRKHRGVVKTTAELLAAGLTYTSGTRTNAKFFLPVSVAYEPAQSTTFPLAPYLVGVLIGDGALRSNCSVTNVDTPIRERIHALGYSTRMYPGGDTYGVHGCMPALRALGLAGKLSIEKRLPLSSFRLSAADRLELLRGLMDTDGDCQKDGSSTFNTSSHGLALDVLELVRGLGGIATLASRQEPKYTHLGETRIGQPAYRVYVRLSVNPFHLPKKADRWKPSILANAIAEITPSTPEDCVCIQVSTKRNLYVTDDYIVTHNTAVAIQAAETIRRRHPTRPVIIVAPLFTRSAWLSELYKTGAIESFRDVCCLTSRDLKSSSWNPMAPYIFCHYDVVSAWWSKINLRRPIFSIVDEAHWIKNGRTQRSKGTMLCVGTTPYCVALTATPMANRPSELWNLLSLLALPFAFGGPLDFRKRYAGAEFNGYGFHDTVPTHVDELQARIRHLYVRKTAKDVGLELPALVRKFVEIEPKDLTEHNKMSPHDMHKVVRALQTGRVGDETLPLLTALRKESSELKIATTVEIASNAIEQGEKIVIFTWQRQQAKRISGTLEKFATKQFGVTEKPRVLYISGDVGEVERAAAIARFQEDTNVVAIVATLQSLKEGVTLHASRTVILHDLDWVPESLRQAERRILRIGQDRTCYVYWPLVKRSIDMLFASMLAKKITSIEKTLGVSLGDFSDLEALIENEEDASWAERMRQWENF